MIERDIVRRVVAAGQVQDEYTSRSIPGALVRTMRDGKLIAQTRTSADGLFYFTDLRDGAYDLIVTCPAKTTRYLPSRTTIEVSRNARNPVFPLPRIGLRPFVISGRITEKGANTPVAMALVMLPGSGERAFSDAEGKYELVAVEPTKAGKGRPVVASANGFGPSTLRAEMDDSASSFKPLNFILERRSAARSTGKKKNA
jgi:hypothetical protein